MYNRPMFPEKKGRGKKAFMYVKVCSHPFRIKKHYLLTLPRPRPYYTHKDLIVKILLSWAYSPNGCQARARNIFTHCHATLNQQLFSMYRYVLLSQAERPAHATN